MPKRDRSEMEENDISSGTDFTHQNAFIASCVDFRTNISLADPASLATATAEGEALARHVLIVGSLANLRASREATRGLLGPLYGPVIESLLFSEHDSVSAGETVSVLVPCAHNTSNVNYHRVTIAALPSGCSRDNCPFRPDAAVAAVAAAAEPASNSSKNTGGPALDVFLFVTPAAAAAHGGDPTRTEEETAALCYAVARGVPHSFSGKGAQCAARGYSAGASATLAVRVIPSDGAVFSPDARKISAAEIENVCGSLQLCQRLVDAPTCVLDTLAYAKICEGIVSKHFARTVKFHEIAGDDLARQGYGGLYAVGKGAERGPRLVTLTYENKQADAENKKDIALVGKGLVYDCGGLSLKTPTTYMCDMKTDMGGSAAVLCGFLALVRNIEHNNALRSRSSSGAAALPKYSAIGRLSVTLCMAENAIGPRSYRNDDILLMKSGKTVEVNNTDAEGRIALADGVSHASGGGLGYTPDLILDMATLTGAQGIATGQRHAAVYASDAAALEAALAAGRVSGDTCFPVLYCPEYHQPLFASRVADMKNLMSATNDAGVSAAGFFIESHLSPEFTGETKDAESGSGGGVKRRGKYVHVDLAFPAHNSTGATGYGVALLAEMFSAGS